MKVFSIGQNIDLANKIQQFALDHYSVDQIQFIPDAAGNLIITADVFINPAYAAHVKELLQVIVDNSELIEYNPVVVDIAAGDAVAVDPSQPSVVEDKFGIRFFGPSKLTLQAAQLALDSPVTIAP